MKTGHLFDETDVQGPRVHEDAASSSADNRVIVAAHQLAVCFTEDGELPSRYRRMKASSAKIRKAKEDTEIDKRFKAKVESWRQLIETMLSNLDRNQAWRFITLRPQITAPIRRVTDNNDFCDFVDYMILRRDQEQCSPDELGGLAQLSVAFQREVENEIRT